MGFQRDADGFTKNSVDSVLDGRRNVDFLVVDRAFDGTQWFVHFGALTDQLVHCARYWTPPTGKQKKGRILTYQEAQTMKISMSMGIVELMGQTCTLQWQESSGDSQLMRRERPIVPVSFMQGAKASAYLEILEEGMPEFSLAKLKALALRICFVCLSLTSDSASTINKFKVWVLTQIL